MDISNRQTVVCYIDSNKILIYYGIIGIILQLDLPSDVVSDLELINSSNFKDLVDSFLKTNKLEGGVVIFIFSSNASFEKDFLDESPGNKDEKIQEFITMIPFEDVLSKTYKLNEKTKVVAINKQIYESIKNVFEKNNYLVLAVVSSYVLKETFEELAQNEDLAFIASKVSSIKQYSITEVSETENQNTKKKPEVVKKNLRIYVMIFIFIILCLVLIVLVAVNFLPKNSSKQLPITSSPFSPSPTSGSVDQQSTPSISPPIPTDEQSTGSARSL